MSALDIEIYGIPPDVAHCPGCSLVLSILNDNEIDYRFYPVMVKKDNELGFDYNRPVIENVAKRIGCYPHLGIRYPVVFINNKKYQKISELKAVLQLHGYCVD